MLALQRDYPQVKYSQYMEDNNLIIRTDRLMLKFKKNDEAECFTADNLSITFRMDNTDVVWFPGMHNTGNIGGSEAGLDDHYGEGEIRDGLLSTSGWYLLDDSGNAHWTDEAIPWCEPRSKDSIHDLYFFAYGRDYKNALNDFVTLSGRIPLLPRWVFGNWQSRWYPFKDVEYQSVIVPEWRKRAPLDVLIIDTDWKYPDTWAGWSWNPELFPNPDQFLNWVRDQGLKIALNIHPDLYKDDPKAADALAVAPTLMETSNGYEFDFNDRDHMKAYFDTLHGPLEKQGIDFFWQDWCIRGHTASLGVDQEWFSAYLYANRLERLYQKRGFVLSRAGGPSIWGYHRYLVHFTGDALSLWSTLDYEPQFTVTSGNMGIAYVSHDIGGFKRGDESIYPDFPDIISDEKQIRWLQFGSFSPIMRIHGLGKYPYEYADQHIGEIASQFLTLRHALIPYLYTLSWNAYDTGLPLCRGMYLYYPEYQESTIFLKQYMLGDQMLVAPIGIDSLEKVPTDVLRTSSGDDYGLSGAYYGTEGSIIADRIDPEIWFSWPSGNVPIEGIKPNDKWRIHWTGNIVPKVSGTYYYYLFFNNSAKLWLGKEEIINQNKRISNPVKMEAGTEYPIKIEYENADGHGFIKFAWSQERIPGTKKLWFPPGIWYDFFTDEINDGGASGKEATVTVPLERYPVYVKAGGILPSQPTMSYEAEKPVDPLILDVYVKNNGSFTLYEDDGEGQGFKNREYCLQYFKLTENGNVIIFTSTKPECHFQGMYETRRYIIRFHGMADKILDSIETDIPSKNYSQGQIHTVELENNPGNFVVTLLMKSK
jgi:alpha-glucosidase (family GH31 glycosyl hydrolase)